MSTGNCQIGKTQRWHGIFLIVLHTPQAPNCAQNRSKRDTEETNDEGHPATIEVYSGLYVNENAEVIDSDDDSVFAEKVTLVV